MQIICNSCLSHNLYQDYLNQPYNPFVSCVWTPEEMLNFIKYYKDLDYTNIDLSLTNDLHINGNEHQCIKCKIDKILTIYFIHSQGYNNDLDICRERYFRRLSRFDVNDNVVFILGYGVMFRDWYFMPGEDLQHCIKFNTMKANTIQFIPYHCKNYNFSENDFPINKTNHTIFVENPWDVLPNTIRDNNKIWLQLTNIINDFDK